MSSILGNLNNLFSGGWILILIFLAVAMVYGFLMGRNRLALITLGTYFSFFIVKTFPWKSLAFVGIEQAPSSNVQIFLFLALVLGFYFLLPHSIFRGMVKVQGRRKSQWWQAGLLAVLQIGLTLEAAMSFLPAKVTGTLSSPAQTFFVGPVAQFLWILLPILAMMFLRTRHYDIGD
ncbi:MAG: hypothetical protein PHW33_00170 [Candidatus Portnoybacteria bacterium]|jgi:hypothetical protein|nr:hypothetical protein [Candidatus Portnoybacteria bacterium]